MEIIEQLEQRVLALLAERDQLKAENNELRQSQAKAFDSLAEEHQALQIQLAREQERNNTALLRIESIVQRLKERVAE